ncbi:MAG: Swt1 family HEPN domain-containing protein [Desulfuromonadaceae bacterium]|nr:Swt1 family HEPN domain-containing protein [Desulfuromonadaceae bacterium]
MVFDLKNLYQANNFSFETKALGRVFCGHVSTEMTSQLSKKLEGNDVDCTVFTRKLLQLISIKVVPCDAKDTSSETPDLKFTKEDIRQVTEDELEVFAENFISHNGWLFHDSSGGERKVRTNERGERIVSFIPTFITFPKDDTECYSGFLLRLYRNYFVGQKEQMKRFKKAATDMTIPQSVIAQFTEATRFQKEYGAIAAFAEQMKREQEMLNTVSCSFVSQQNELITQSTAIAKAIYHDMDILRESARQSLIQSVTIPASIIADFKKQQEVSELLRKHESMFRLPQALEVARLIDADRLGAVAKFAQQHAQFINGQKIALEAITTPWLHKIHATRSVTALLELQGIGTALKTLKGFDPAFTVALRQDFGDWRDKISFPEIVFTDSVARTDYYEDRGFNSALTDFPEIAFHQGLDLAGLDDTYIDLELFASIIPRSDDPEVEAGLKRTNICHDWIQRFERMLRHFINEKMTEQYGPKWPKKRLPPNLYEKWVSKQQSAENNGEIITIIDAADFTDYELIICRQDNWREVFEYSFKRKESVRESLQRLQPIRIAAMHSRIVTKEDELYLKLEIVRLIGAIK